MNISQHCFVPRTRSIKNAYYSLDGVLQTASSAVDISTTGRQIKDVYNSYQLFGIYVPFNYYSLRLFGRNGEISSEGGGIGLGNSSNYQSPLVVVGSQNWFNSSALTFKTSRYSNGLPVLSVMWYEKPLISSKGKKLSSDEKFSSYK